MNVWFEQNTDLELRCTNCRELIELDALTMMVSRVSKARRKAHPFHPYCFPPFIEKIYNIKKRTKVSGDRAIRHNLSNQLRYLSKQYYKLAEKKPLSDYDKIVLYTYRIKSRLLYNELLQNGGPLVYKGHDSILITNKPLWLEDNSEYEEWEGINIQTIYTQMEQRDEICTSNKSTT